MDRRGDLVSFQSAEPGGRLHVQRKGVAWGQERLRPSLEPSQTLVEGIPPSVHSCCGRKKALGFSQTVADSVTSRRRRADQPNVTKPSSLPPTQQVPTPKQNATASLDATGQDGWHPRGRGSYNPQPSLHPGGVSLHLGTQTQGRGDDRLLDWRCQPVQRQSGPRTHPSGCGKKG